MMADNEKDKRPAGGNQQRDDAFAPAPADGNVFPPGAPQTSHGSAAGPAHEGMPDTPGDGQSRQRSDKKQ
jgi:hypothetical protein